MSYQTLTEKEKANAEHAIQVEVSNATFYSCAAEKTDDTEGKLLSRPLGKSRRSTPQSGEKS
ncbi:MAG: hypothetical protein ACOYOS_21390 [Syntrophales bacterium]